MIQKRERDDGTRWLVYGRRGGKQVYVGSYDSLRVAKDAEEDNRATQRRIDRGELPPEVDDKRTLNEASTAWLASLLANKARSHRAYSEFMRYQVLPKLGAAVIARITKPAVMKWRDDLATRYAPSTVNSALACLSSAMSDFVDRGWLASNPCHGVHQVEVRDRAYDWIRTRGELERLLGVCPDELRDMVAIAIGTGLRLDEMLHLAWDDVDLEHRLLTIQRGRQGTVKGGRIRHVPILDSLLPVLRRRALARGGGMFLFPGRPKVGAPTLVAGHEKRSNEQPRTKTPVQVAFKHALRRAGLDTKLRWHDLRHTMASWWVLGGGDIFRLSKLLGHASVKVTQQTYAHLAPEAWQQDYHRLPFHVPSEPAKVYEFVRGADNRIRGKRAVTGDEREATRLAVAS